MVAYGPGYPGDSNIIIYGYTPSIVIAILGAVIFFTSAIVHTFQVVRYKTWWFSFVAFGTVLEVVGYVFRSFSSKIDPYRVVYFVVQYFFIVCAPVFFSASIYLCLSKLIEATPSSHAPFHIKPKTILIIFVINDVISTILQVAGAALIGSAESNRKDPTAANNILLGGLAYQVFSFTIWLILYVTFVAQFRPKGPEEEKFRHESGGSGRLTRKQMTFVVALFIAALAVYLRTIFRLAETAQGVFGELMTHEGYFAGLEFVPIVVAVVVLNIWHPGRWIFDVRSV